MSQLDNAYPIYQTGGLNNHTLFIHGKSYYHKCQQLIAAVTECYKNQDKNPFQYKIFN